MDKIELIKDPAVILYFTSSECNVCKVLLPKVKEMAQNKYPEFTFHTIKADEDRKMAATFEVLDEIFDAFRSTYSSSQFVLGDPVREFEKKYAHTQKLFEIVLSIPLIVQTFHLGRFIMQSINRVMLSP